MSFAITARAVVTLANITSGRIARPCVWVQLNAPLVIELTRPVIASYRGRNAFDRLGTVVDAELVTLASSGATTLVTLMVTDGWKDLKARAVALFGHGGDAKSVADELEAARTKVLEGQAAGDGHAEADVRTEWDARLRQLIQEDAGARQSLNELVEAHASQVARAVVTTEIHDNTFHGPAPINSGSGAQTNNFGTSR